MIANVAAAMAAAFIGQAASRMILNAGIAHALAESFVAAAAPQRGEGDEFFVVISRPNRATPRHRRQPRVGVNLVTSQDLPIARRLSYRPIPIV